MDSAALETAKMLGTGSVQLILAVGIVFFAIVAVGVTFRLLSELKSCAAQTLDLALKGIESNNKLVEALSGLERVIEASMRAPR
jgi:hypothetical protein